jgi:hypothetical protein
MELNNYILDIVYAEDGGCRMRSYSIASTSAASAYERFANEETEEFPIVYEGEVVPAIIIGVSQQ